MIAAIICGSDHLCDFMLHVLEDEEMIRCHRCLLDDLTVRQNRLDMQRSRQQNSRVVKDMLVTMSDVVSAQPPNQSGL